MPDELPQIDILVATYNQEEHIGEAVTSALNQNYPNLRVIVSDDCSSDKTPEVLNSFADPRLEIHRNSKNLGLTENYRKLLYEHAGGEWALVLDGDNYLVWDNYLTHCMNNFNDKISLNLIFANAYRDQDGKLIETEYPYPQVFNGFTTVKRLLLGKSTVEDTSALFRRKVGLDIGFFDCDVLSTLAESLLRIACTGKVGFVERKASAWRITPGGLSQSPSTDECYESLSKFFPSLMKQVQNSHPERYRRLENYALKHRAQEGFKLCQKLVEENKENEVLDVVKRLREDIYSW